MWIKFIRVPNIGAGKVQAGRNLRRPLVESLAQNKVSCEIRKGL